MFSKLSGSGAVAVLMATSLISVEGQNQYRPQRITKVDDDKLHDFQNYRDHSSYQDYSCNKCIRAGFTYMYQYIDADTESSEYFQDLNRYQDYSGVCCDKKKNGDLLCVKDGAEIPTDNRPISSMFENQEVAIAACPTKQSVCGKKRHFIYDSKMNESSTIDIDFALPDEDYVYVPKIGAREPFDIEKDECHWLIQTKCDVPVIKVSHGMDAVSQTKADELLQYDIKEIQGAEYEPNEVDLDAASPDDFLRLSYIEYSPSTVQQYASKTVQYIGDYPGFKASPYFVEGSYTQKPGSFADLRQFVKVKGQTEEDEVRFIDQFAELEGQIKYRWFPAELISSDLEMYQKNLNMWNMEREVNDEDIREYNKKVNFYKGLITEFIDFQKEFYRADNVRMAEENDTTPRGRLNNGKIPVLPDGQVTLEYRQFVAAFERAENYFNENFAEQPYPRYLNDPLPYSGYDFDDFMPIYGYGLMTSGTISLDDVHYGPYKSFGVFGQSGTNLKEQYELINRMQEIDRLLGSGQFADNEEKEALEGERDFIRQEKVFERQENVGMSLAVADGSCSTSYMLLSLTPNTLDEGSWNARGSISGLKIEITAESIDVNKPLTPSNLNYGQAQLKIDEYDVAPPGKMAQDQTEGGAYLKAASAAVLSLAALTLY